MTPLLPLYLSHAREAEPSPGLRMPDALIILLAENDLRHCAETDSSGNCGPHAFALGLADLARRCQALYKTNAYKLLTGKLKAGLPAYLDHLRHVAVQWLTNHGDEVLWERMLVKDLVLMMASADETFGQYLQRMRKNSEWADASFLHALACHYRVDCIVWAEHGEPMLIGNALAKDSGQSFGYVPIAMVNDLHFWGVVEERMQLCVVDPPAVADGKRQRSKSPIAARKRSRSKSPMRGTPCSGLLNAEGCMSDVDLEKELKLCEVLTTWDPFSEPSVDLLHAVASAPPADPRRATNEKCLLRSQVIEQLSYEHTMSDKLPRMLQYHAASRYRLKRNVPVLGGSDGLATRALYASQRSSAKVQLLLSLGAIKRGIAADCNPGHHCLDSFRENPNAVRNWRVLWRSIPKRKRKEALIVMYQASRDQHRADRSPGAWQLIPKFLGHPVCVRALRALTGLGGSSLTDARNAVRDGRKTVYGANELMTYLSAPANSKPALYLDARQWLEYYSDTHAEMSPMTLEAYLPAGRKEMYWHQYRADRVRLTRTPCSLPLFLCAWRTECPWLIVCRSVSKFTKCGVCEYLKMMLDQCPRALTEVSEKLRARLGQHFQFQGAQRIAMGKLEEIADQSDGRIWAMSIDKMDQNCAFCPQVWAMSSTALFKGGERLMCAINGSIWAGTQNTRHHLRTMFQDCKHGSEMQSSTFLLNVWETAMKEGHLCEELIIHTDNTAKETKNNTMMRMLIWLLCVLPAEAPLKSIMLAFLIVGHTHNKVDRMFSRLKVAMSGHDFFTPEQLMQTVMAGMPGWDISHSHLTRVWAWKQLDKLQITPFVGFRLVHCMNIFRKPTGIWVKWKQYLTCETWSKPVLIVPADRMRLIAEWRPAPVVQKLETKALAALLLWLDKFEVALSDGSRELNERRADLHRLRSIVRRENPAYTTGPSVDKIIADLSCLRGVGQRRVAESPMPEDQLVTFFSGADIPLLPVDSLIKLPKAPAIPGQEPALDVIGPGSMLIVSAVSCPTKVRGTTLLFSLAKIMEDVHDADELLVSWYVPCVTAEASMKAGTKKKVVDIFGEWTKYEDLSTEEANNVEVAPVLIDPSAVLLHNFAFALRVIPYAVFDQLRSRHGIDVTQLSVSLTRNGNLYRAAVLLSGTGE